MHQTYFKSPTDKAKKKREQVEKLKTSLLPRHKKGLPRRRYPKSERKALVKEADRVFSLFIRARDGNQCFTANPKCRGAIQCGHLISRTNYSVRWDEENAHAQCAGCNLLHEYHPERFTARYINLHGLAKYDELVKRANGGGRTTDTTLTGIVLFYRQQLKKLGVES